MKGVNIYSAEKKLISNTQKNINGEWVKARPEGLQGFIGLVNNIQCATKVLLGKADIVIWEHQ